MSTIVQGKVTAPRFDFWKGLIRENPSFVLLLGMCPTLGITTSFYNGFGMGVATTLVLIASNMAISALKKVIPDMVRIPSFIVIIAGFVTVLQFVIKAYAPSLDDSLGIFIPLIVANCIVLGRAEAFAAKNTVWYSFLDGASAGVGIIFALSLLGGIREVLATGAIFSDTPFFFDFLTPFNDFLNSVFAGTIHFDFKGILGIGLAPGSFIVLGFVIAFFNWQQKRAKARKAEVGAKVNQELQGAAISGGNQ